MLRPALLRSALLLVVIIVLPAVGLRIWATGGDLWIDEVWSLDQIQVARQSADLKDWIALLFHSNTHALNSGYLAFVGPDASPLAYRFLSLISGIMMLLVAIWIGFRKSVSTGVIAAILFGLSYPLINYSGEARGYAPMMLCALAGFALLTSYLDKPSLQGLIGFVCVSLLGLLSHLLFGIVLAGFGLWAADDVLRDRKSVVAAIARLVPLFGLQFIVSTLFAVVAVNNMVRGGDCCPELALPSIRIMTYWTLGLDADQVTSYLPLAMVAGAALTLVIGLMRQKQSVAVFYAIVLIVFPLVTVAVEQSPQVIHRYFLPMVLFLLLLFCDALGNCWDAGGWKKCASILFIVGFCLGQAGLLVNFANGGRGHYGDALKFISAADSRRQTVTGYPTFSVGSVFKSTAKSMKLEDRLDFVAAKNEGAVAADWFINGYLDGRLADPVIERKIPSGMSKPYQLVKVFPQWGLSGDAWAVYRLQP